MAFQNAFIFKKKQQKIKQMLLEANKDPHFLWLQNIEVPRPGPKTHFKSNDENLLLVCNLLFSLEEFTQTTFKT